MTDGPIVMSFDIILRLDVYNTKATVHCTPLSREAFYHVMIQQEKKYGKYVGCAKYQRKLGIYLKLMHLKVPKFELKAYNFIKLLAYTDLNI